jgi:hypothetical protein
MCSLYIFSNFFYTSVPKLPPQRKKETFPKKDKQIIPKKNVSTLNGIQEKNILIRPIKSVLSHPGVFLVIVARLHILLYAFNKLADYETFAKFLGFRLSSALVSFLWDASTGTFCI